MSKVYPITSEDCDEDFDKIIKDSLYRRNRDENITTPVGWVKMTTVELTEIISQMQEKIDHLENINKIILKSTNALIKINKELTIKIESMSND